jgi:hypothetical protein
MVADFISNNLSQLLLAAFLCNKYAALFENPVCGDHFSHPSTPSAIHGQGAMPL